MFNKAAHDRGLPCSSAPFMTPTAAAQQPYPTYTFTMSQKHHRKHQTSKVTTHSFKGKSQRGSRSYLSCRAEASQPDVRHPVAREAKAFAPATIANLGPGFDWMGCAVEVIAPLISYVTV